jgi:tripartite-type tricarboxylate transporter receptor subunit TctC
MRPETQLRLASIGAEPMPMSSQEFSKQIEIDRKNWEKLMREINF